jgi:periplasmic divalent cation tolerance protein
MAVVVLSTAGSQEEAERIATALVEERLAACVNLVAPITSIYRWQGKVERAAEVLLIIKTRRSSSAGLIARLGELHSYDVPEAIVLPIATGARPYLQWLLGETAALPARRPARRRASSRK